MKLVKDVIPMHWPPLFLILISVRGEVYPQSYSTAGKIKSLKNPSDPIGNRNRNLPACSAVLDLYRSPIIDRTERSEDTIAWVGFVEDFRECIQNVEEIYKTVTWNSEWKTWGWIYWTMTLRKHVFGWERIELAENGVWSRASASCFDML